MTLLYLAIGLMLFYCILAYVKRNAPGGEGRFWLVWAVLCALSVILFAFKSKVGHDCGCAVQVRLVPREDES